MYCKSLPKATNNTPKTQVDFTKVSNRYIIVVTFILLEYQEN